MLLFKCLWVNCRMKLCNWIKKNRLLRFDRLVFIEKSSVNERLKAIIKEKWKDPET